MAAPAVAFVEHAGAEAYGFARGGFALEGDFAAPRGEVGRLYAGRVEILAEIARALRVPDPAAAAAAFGEGGVGEVGVARVERGDVVVAVNAERIVLQRAAAVDHHAARRIDGHDGVVRLLDLGFVGIHVGRAAEQVDQVDEGELVLDRPDLDGGMVALALDLGDALVGPVLHQRELELRAALPRDDGGILLVELVADHLAVERCVAAHDDAVRVEEGKGLVRFEIEPERAVRGLARRREAVGALVAGAVALDPQRGRRARGTEVRPHPPGDAVEQELRAANGPFAEAKGGLPDINGPAVFKHRGAQRVERRAVRPPELRRGPGDGGGDGLRFARLEGDGDRPGLCRDLSRGGVNGLEEDRWRPRGNGGVAKRDLALERLARHRGLDEDVGGVDGARGVEDGRGEKAGLGAVPDGVVEVLEAVAQELARKVERLAQFHRVRRVGAAPVPGVANADEDFVVLSGLDRGGDVDGEAAEGVLFEAAEAAVDVDRRVEVVEWELDLEGASRERGGDADARAVPDAVGEFEILAQLALVPRDGDGAEDGVAWQGLDRLGDFAGRLLVVAGDFPDALERDGRACGARGLAELEDVLRRGFVLVVAAALVGLEPAVRAERLRGDAERVAGEEQAVGLAVGLRRSRQADLQRMRAGGEIDVAELQPGDFAPEVEGHQIRGEILGRDAPPVAVVDAPFERRACELVPDAPPDLARARRVEGEGIADDRAVRGDDRGDLVRLHEHLHPFALGEEFGVAPARVVDGDVGLAAFAFEPDVGGVHGRSAMDEERCQQTTHYLLVCVHVLFLGVEKEGGQRIEPRLGHLHLALGIRVRPVEGVALRFVGHLEPAFVGVDGDDGGFLRVRFRCERLDERADGIRALGVVEIQVGEQDDDFRVLRAEECDELAERLLHRLLVGRIPLVIRPQLNQNGVGGWGFVIPGGHHLRQRIFGFRAIISFVVGIEHHAFGDIGPCEARIQPGASRADEVILDVGLVEQTLQRQPVRVLLPAGAAALRDGVADAQDAVGGGVG